MKVWQDRPYQGRLINKALDLFLAQQIKSVLIRSPVGSGKTPIGLRILAELQKRGMKVGWSAMRRELLNQAQKENQEFGFGVDFSSISMFEKHPPKVDVLAVDECQHDAAASMVHIHKQSKCKLVLGLSATPYRTDRVGLCFQKQISDIGIEQLIREGWLSQYHHFTIENFSPKNVATHYLRDPGHWGKSIVYFRTELECLEFQSHLFKAGVNCEMVTGKSDRETQLARFDNGEVNVIVNMVILTEGFDCPNLKTAFIRPSSTGPTIQMGGRVFRTHESLPFKQIVQCTDTKYPFQREATPKEQYLWTNGEFRSILINENLDAMARESAKAMLSAMADESLQKRTTAAGYTKDELNGGPQPWYRRRGR